MQMYDLINKKKNKEVLTKEEIELLLMATPKDQSRLSNVRILMVVCLNK